jgi:hypothetical protein
MRESAVEATSPAINEIATVIHTAELAAVDERRAGNLAKLFFFLTERMAKVRKDILCRYRILLTIDR